MLPGHTDVVTANVLGTLPPGQARAALQGILADRPDLVGLQEWGLSRRGLLRETGSLRRLSGRGDRSRGTGADGGYLWASPLLGACPVGVRAARYDLVGWRTRVLGWPGRSDRGARPFPVTPLRVATVAVLWDRVEGRDLSLVNFHLTPGVQSRGTYRADRPRLVARHRDEVRRLTRVVGEQLALGHTVVAVGDSNFDGLQIEGLTSAWEGRAHEPGTLGPHRKIDDVHGPGRAVSVTLLSSASDHKAVLVRRRDLPRTSVVS
jgi:hypothetical protein